MLLGQRRKVRVGFGLAAATMVAPVVEKGAMHLPMTSARWVSSMLVRASPPILRSPDGIRAAAKVCDAHLTYVPEEVRPPAEVRGCELRCPSGVDSKMLVGVLGWRKGLVNVMRFFLFFRRGGAGFLPREPLAPGRPGRSGAVFGQRVWWDPFHLGTAQASFEGASLNAPSDRAGSGSETS